MQNDVVGVNAGVEGMGVIPAVIGNIGHHPPMGLHHQHNHYKQTNTKHFPMRLQKYKHKSVNTQMGISASPSTIITITSAAATNASTRIFIFRIYSSSNV